MVLSTDDLTVMDESIDCALTEIPHQGPSDHTRGGDGPSILLQSPSLTSNDDLDTISRHSGTLQDMVAMIKRVDLVAMIEAKIVSGNPI